MITALTNHLWQSTLFAVVIALASVACRHYRAYVRHGLWLTASVKFLLPFALLMNLGGHFAWRSAPAESATSATPAVSVAVQQLAEPFTDGSPSLSPSTSPVKPHVDWLPVVLFGVWACGFVAVVLVRLRGWQRIRAAVRASVPLDAAGTSGVAVRSAPGLLEPGVVGWWRPILLVPTTIAACLTPAQLEAVLTHELCHVRRRDNLTSAIHMVVEAVAWFHPMVWWIGARLVEERERACDEDALRQGGEPAVYAEAILNVCKLYVESPLACVSGVTGADIKKRVQAILAERVGRELTIVNKLALAGAAVAVIAVPMLVGAATTPMLRDQSASAQSSSTTMPKFDVVSIKPCDPQDSQGSRGAGAGAGSAVSPDRLVEHCLTALNLIQNAYLRFANGRGHSWWSVDVPIEGGPDWMAHEPYEVQATTPAATTQEMMRGPMLQAVLEDRFHLKLHRTTHQGPVYELVVSASGLKMKPAEKGACVPQDWSVFPMPPLPDGQHRCSVTTAFFDATGNKLERPSAASTVTVTWSDEAISLDEVATDLLHLDRPVVNKTDISGVFALRLTHAIDRTNPDDGFPVGNAHVAALALKEQLGLELRPATGDLGALVIDHIERPTPNDAVSTIAPASQTPAPMHPATKFDVVSIKPCAASDQPPSGRAGGRGAGAANGGGASPTVSPGRIALHCETLGSLIQTALAQFAGGRPHPIWSWPDIDLKTAPSWAHSDRFTIEATADPATPVAVMRGPMLQAVPEDRFKLGVHHETRDVPVYELVVAKGGPKLTPFTLGECVPDDEVGFSESTQQSGQRQCMNSVRVSRGSAGPVWEYNLEATTLPGAVMRVMGLDRPVVNRTGITGLVTFRLTYTGQDLGAFAVALKDQLGLELRPARGPREFLIINHVERPTPNGAATVSLLGAGLGR